MFTYFPSLISRTVSVDVKHHVYFFACTELERQLPMHPMENEKSPEDPGLTIDFISGTKVTHVIMTD